MNLATVPRQSVEAFLQSHPGTAERIQAVEAALGGPAGPLLRTQLGKWIVQLVPVETLVPDLHRHWRPLVRDAMLFVVSHLSAARLAPKVVAQVELPADTPPEARLLRLISRVPGLQKIGQVLARNRRLYLPLRLALSELENGISDVTIEDVRKIIFEQLGPQIRKYGIKVADTILSEASVSAVVRFTWRNPDTRRRERCVFKVLKPYIPDCYAEDMKILQQLAGYLTRKHRSGGTRLAGLAETLTEIRLLLEHEVDFRREQRTLRDAVDAYRSVRGVRVPRVVELLSTNTITALTEERGVKVTEAFARAAGRQPAVAERLAKALIAVPALSRKELIFHADPHAGNLLYDKRQDTLVILDWALTERLTRAQRRNVLMLVLMLMLRDGPGVGDAIERLVEAGAGNRAVQGQVIRERTAKAIAAQPLFRLPGAMDAMRLLDQIALDGVRFPAALLMFRKASFTLDAVLEDMAGAPVRMDAAVARYAVDHWFATATALFSILSLGDWMALQWSAFTLGARLCAKAITTPWPLPSPAR